MTSRFSTLQKRDDAPARAPEPPRAEHQAVVIPNDAQAGAAPKPETAPAKTTNKRARRARRASTGC